jgi:hypothetical protein
VNVALDIALADMGVWGAGLIAAGTFIVNRAIDRARLVNPPKQQAQAPDAARMVPGLTEPEPATSPLPKVVSAA